MRTGIVTTRKTTAQQAVNLIARLAGRKRWLLLFNLTNV